MSDQPSFPDQSTSDALSALSALASQASLHPAYEFSSNEDGGNQNLQLHDGEGQPPPPSSATNLPHLNHNNDDVEGQWDAAQEQTFAEMVAENEAHQAIEAAARAGNGHLLDAAGHPADLTEGGEGSRAHEQVVQAIHAASQAQAQAAQAAGNASGGGGAGSGMDSNELGAGGSQTGEKKPKRIRAPGTTVTNPFAHQWLLENYVPSPQTTIQRTSMYASYVSVCEASDVKPVNAATFGKSIRSTFENVRTRRLGNRGNSRYNYCGIKAFTQAELDRLVQFGNVTTENGAICPTKVKRKKTNLADPTDVSMEDAADGDDDENDEDGFDDDEEDEFEDDEDDLLPAHNRSAPAGPKASSSKRTPGKTAKPGTVHIVEIEINGQWVPHIPDGNDGYVPSDSKGNPLVPLPPPLGSDIASTSASASAPAAPPTQAASGAGQEPTSTSNGPARPKRNRNSLAPEIVASMLDDSDTPSTTPKGKKRGPSKEGDGEWAGAAKAAKKPKVGGGASAKSTPKGKGKTTEPKVVKKDALTEGFDQLRDVVPALRAVFRTTTPLTQAMDTPDPATGLIDGILPVSTLKDSKVTILVTAKKYIDHLDKERQKTERARKGLEEFIKKIEGGVEALRGWREYFEISEKALIEEEQAARAIAAAAALPSLPSLPDLQDQNALAGPSSLSGYDPNLDPSILHQDLQVEGSSSSNHFSDPSNPYGNLLLHDNNEHFEEQQHYEQAPGPAPFDTSSFALAALAPALGPALAAAEQNQQGEDAPESEEVRKVAETRLKNRRKQQQYREKQKSKMLDLEEQIRQMAQNQASSSSSSSQQHPYPDQQHDANEHQLQEDQNQALLHLGQQFKQEAFEEQNERGETLRDLLSQQEELQQQLGNQEEDQFYDQLDEDQELDQLNEEQE